jgi:hypothetical protein
MVTILQTTNGHHFTSPPGHIIFRLVSSVLMGFWILELILHKRKINILLLLSRLFSLYLLSEHLFSPLHIFQIYLDKHQQVRKTVTIKIIKLKLLQAPRSFDPVSNIVREHIKSIYNTVAAGYFCSRV